MYNLATLVRSRHADGVWQFVAENWCLDELSPHWTSLSGIWCSKYSKDHQAHNLRRTLWTSISIKVEITLIHRFVKVWLCHSLLRILYNTACMSGVETGDMTRPADHQWKGLHRSGTQFYQWPVSILFLFLASSPGKYQVFVRMNLMPVLPVPMLELRSLRSWAWFWKAKMFAPLLHR